MLRTLASCGLAVAPVLAAASAWTSRPGYPLAPGMAGAIAGAHRGVIIAAGGANFPDKMPWDGGKKVYHDEIFVIGPGDAAWRSAGRLPEKRAYAASVSTPGGVLVIGGENADTIFADTLLLAWDGVGVSVTPGPALPAPRTGAVAALLDGSVFLAGGYAPGVVRESTGDFLRLDGRRRDAGWEPLPTWPGPTRAQAVMAALDGAIYLISGLEMTTDAAGKPKPVYLGDAYRFRAARWERLPDPLWTAIAAPTPAPVQAGQVFVLGGVDGRLVGKVPRDTRVPDHVMVFDVAAHAWRELPGRWPDPVVTAPAVEMGGDWWIVSGETMAGVRTTSVSSWKIPEARP